MVISGKSQGSLLIHPLLPTAQGWVLSCALTRMTEIIAIRNKKGLPSVAKRNVCCVFFFNPLSFLIRSHSSYAFANEEPTKGLLPALSSTCARLAACRATQRTTAGPQNACCEKVPGLAFGFICRCSLAVTQEEAQKHGPARVLPKGSTAPAVLLHLGSWHPWTAAPSAPQPLFCPTFMVVLSILYWTVSL